MHVCMYLCMYVRMYIWYAYVCMYECMYVNPLTSLYGCCFKISGAWYLENREEKIKIKLKRGKGRQDTYVPM
jgi:hypothetical protein